MPDPEGDPTVQPDEPVPPTEKSLAVSPVTDCPKLTVYVSVEAFVIVGLVENVVSSGPNEVITTNPVDEFDPPVFV